MPRRADPQRIFQAWRIATRNNLMGSGMTPETADRWLVAWELRRPAGGPRVSAYWDVGQGVDGGGAGC